MFGNRLKRSSWWSWETGVVVAVLLLALLASRAFADEAPPRKIMRQIGVMEQIIDQVLVDSPNFLVRGRDNARGIYLEEYGVVLSLDASLIELDWKFGKNWSWGGGIRVEQDDDGNRVLIVPGDEDEEDGDVIPLDEDEDGEEDEEGRSWRDRRNSRQERLYLRGKAELVDVLLDYGDTLTALKAGRWVSIIAFLRDADYFLDNKFSHLVLKAKIDDLRDYSAEKISEEEMIRRISTVEY